MRRWLKKNKQGFTLIELMIVVAIVGILSVLAIYGVRKYIANAKTAEARNSLGQIAKDAATAVEREKGTGAIIAASSSVGTLRSFCASSTSVPGAMSSVQNAKYQSATTDWGGTATSGWTCLKFSMDEPQYFEYTYTMTGSSAISGGFNAVANGDLNGDGNSSTFTVTGSALNGAVAISPNIAETNPEE